VKVATLDLSADLFLEFSKACKAGPPRRFVVKENALPDDAEIVRVRYYDPDRLRLFITSESFADVREGGEPPELPPVVFTTQYDGAAADGVKQEQ
jgi:hypothetical protein